jgi:hypothetical protein
VQIIEKDIRRRAVIEAYARYDYRKKSRGAIETFASWDWSDANAIDGEMLKANLKVGIPAGYLIWDKIAVTAEDLLECAVHDAIFPGKPRMLGDLERSGYLTNWRPNAEKEWYDRIAQGETLDEAEPLLLRRAVRSESPAQWYIEGGSGRAVALITHRKHFEPSQILAVGYLGRDPDPQSAFMRNHFGELLNGGVMMRIV